jgi:hypothetical protein
MMMMVDGWMVTLVCLMTHDHWHTSVMDDARHCGMPHACMYVMHDDGGWMHVDAYVCTHACGCMHHMHAMDACVTHAWGYIQSHHHTPQAMHMHYPFSTNDRIKTESMLWMG